MSSVLETGGNLSELQKYALKWFQDNNVEIPEGAKKWSKCYVRAKQIPPGTTYQTLRKQGINLSDFIAGLLNTKSQKVVYSPITPENIQRLIGLIWIDYTWVNGHKRVTTECMECMHREVLDYGTLQRMKAAGNKLCRYCRGAGGKEKDLTLYDKFEGFKVLSRSEDGRFLYRCNECSSTIERTLTHVNQAEYFVCEHCNPRENFGARHYTDLGYFDSKLEYEAYKIILKFISPDRVDRQKKYDTLFNTGTNHKADFYLVDYNIILEVTSKYNKIGAKYKETAEWKKSLSDNVIFAYSLQEVEDIVRSLVKTSELTVEYGGSLLRSRIKWR